MAEMYELLSEMGMPLTDEAYCSYIRSSMSHIQSFQNLFTSIDVIVETGGKSLPPSALINQIHAQWKGDKVAKHAEQLMEGTAMVAKGWRSKAKGKQRDSKKTCKNCKKKGHSADECFAEGGGQADNTPKWWKNQQKKMKEVDKSKREREKTANAASRDSDNESLTTDSEHAALAWSQPPIFTTHALTCTSEFVNLSVSDTANTASPKSQGEILDMGASAHFSAKRSKFINLRELTSSDMSLIRTTDGNSFRALGRGDFRTEFQMEPGQKPTPITLEDMYYSPKMAFTLVSVSHLDKAGYKLEVSNGKCHIRSPKAKIIGIIPLKRGLYRVTDKRHQSANTILFANIATSSK